MTGRGTSDQFSSMNTTSDSVKTIRLLGLLMLIRRYKNDLISGNLMCLRGLINQDYNLRAPNDPVIT